MFNLFVVAVVVDKGRPSNVFLMPYINYLSETAMAVSGEGGMGWALHFPSSWYVSISDGD